MLRGKVSSQIIEESRRRLDDFDKIYFGKVIFELRFGTIFRIKTENEVLTNKNEKPEDVLKKMSKEELINLIIGRKGGT